MLFGTETDDLLFHLQVLVYKFIGGYLMVSLLLNICGFLSGNKFVIEQQLLTLLMDCHVVCKLVVIDCHWSTYSILLSLTEAAHCHVGTFCWQIISLSVFACLSVAWRVFIFLVVDYVFVFHILWSWHDVVVSF